MSRERNESADLEEMRATAARILGDPGRLITSSKSGYVRARPTNVVVFNAQLITRTAEGLQSLWKGDLDLTLWEERLAALAGLLERELYVLYESEPWQPGDAKAPKRALAAIPPTGSPSFPTEGRFPIIRAEDGTLRFKRGEESRSRLKLRLLAHRPRLWRFWEIERHRDVPRRDQELVTRVYLGRRASRTSPLLVLSIGRCYPRLETIRTLEATWHPADGISRHAGRALINRSGNFRIGGHKFVLQIRIWPASIYQLKAEWSEECRD